MTVSSSSFIDRQRVLLVEPALAWRGVLSAAVGSRADVEIVETFEAARARLDGRETYDVLVANLRLGAYNGIHLAYLARMSGAASHVIVHCGANDAAAAADVQRSGAIYELTERLAVALPSYLGGGLPPSDRRDPAQTNQGRPEHARRRAWDRYTGVGPEAATDRSVAPLPQKPGTPAD